MHDDHGSINVSLMNDTYNSQRRSASVLVLMAMGGMALRHGGIVYITYFFKLINYASFCLPTPIPLCKRRYYIIHA